MPPKPPPGNAEQFFTLVASWPKTVLLLGLSLIIATAVFIPSLEKDTRSDAFIPADHPALVYRDKVKEIFGQQDPMVIAVVNEGPQGVFNPHTLALLSQLTDEISQLDNVDPGGITSLATENDIIGTFDGLRVEPFFDEPPTDQADADRIRHAVMDFPLYLGSLVARNGQATLIVAELLDQTQAQQTYQTLLDRVAQLPTTEGEAIHVAGEGAVSGYMGAYIDADAQRLNPIAGTIITLVLFLAFRTLRGTLLPNLVVLGTVATALGTMAAFGVPFFVITNALPVVLIGIAVADSIHILSQYYEEIARRPNAAPRKLVIATMVHMWRPITLTTATTVAGFLGLTIASVMPPMLYFGLFAMLGVTMAWVYSMTVVPAVLTLLKLKTSPAYRDPAKIDAPARVMAALGTVVIAKPYWVLSFAAVIAAAGLFFATQLELNEARITTFQQDEPIVVADRVINAQFDGAHYLDIVIETDETEALFRPDHLQRIAALQDFVLTLPHVNGATSIVDYLKQMNRALNEDRTDAYALPDDAHLTAQYFLLYSASGDPTDFEEEVDYDYRLANLRVRLDTGRYNAEKAVVEAAQHYIDTTFNTAEITATLSGRVNIDYHWIKRLGDSHLGSIAVSLLLVWLMAALSLRSAIAGVITVIPVALSILLIYAVMGLTGIWLAVGTSMFAAIAIGLGVDFAIHSLERLVVLVRDKHRDLDEAIAAMYPSTGRALLFNFAALTLGFGVLTTSEVVPLIRFGAMVALAVSVSFLASMTVLPALIKVLQPRFLGLRTPHRSPAPAAPIDTTPTTETQGRS